MLTDVTVWLSTYLLHSTVLLGIAALVSRLSRGRHRAAREAVWKAALIGGLITTTLQLALGVVPLAGSWSIPGPTTDVATLASTSTPQHASLTATEGRVSVAPAVTSNPATMLLAESPEPTPLHAAAVSVPREQPASPRPAALGSTLVRNAVTWGAVAWAVPASALLLLLAAAYIRMRRLLASRTIIDEGPLRVTLDGILTAENQVRKIHLSSTPQLEVPIALGIRRPEICLPERALSHLTPEQQETLLAHEAAHLLRHDPLWLLISRVVESILFLQPLNRLAGRRLRALAEDSCDDWTVERTGRPLALARCLTEVAGWQLRHSVTSLPVPTMARGRSGLDRRVRRLVNRRYPLPARGIPRWLTPLVASGLVLMVIAAPAVMRADNEAPKRSTLEATTVPETAPILETSPLPAAPPAPRAARTPQAPPAPEPAPKAPVAPAPTAPASVAVGTVAPAAESAPVSPVAPTPPPAPFRAPTAPEAPTRQAERIAPLAQAAPLAATPAEVETTTDEVESENEVSVSELRSEMLEDEIDEIFEDIDEALEEVEEDLDERIDEIEDIADERFDYAEDGLDELVDAYEDEFEERLEGLEDEIGDWEDRIGERYDRAGISDRKEEALDNDIEDLEDRLDNRMDVLDDRLGEIEDRYESRLESRFEEDLEGRLEMHEENLSNRFEKSQRDLDRLEVEAERLAESGRLTDAEVERIRAEAERVAREARPTADEMAELRRSCGKPRSSSRSRARSSTPLGRRSRPPSRPGRKTTKRPSPSSRPVSRNSSAEHG